MVNEKDVLGLLPFLKSRIQKKFSKPVPTLMPIKFTGPVWEQVEDLRIEQGVFAGGKGEDITAG